MKVRDIMTSPAISIRDSENLSVAARTLAHYNIGALPVQGQNGKVCGVITDRDIVTRCLAANRSAENTTVREVMTSQVLSVEPDMDAGAAAHLMGRQQVRRLPVVERGELCGMLSLGDLANREEMAYDAGDALADISSQISNR